LLFPAISLLLLAYTNRFLALAAVIRSLHSRYKTQPDEVILAQIKNLRSRVIIIRNMQWMGVLSFFLCVLCMLLLYAEKEVFAEYVFGASLLFLLSSLLLSVQEIMVSVKALNLQLSDMEDLLKKTQV
ncbi:DUF2721 domain-containing protein, partial [Xanthovirga aplysinae]|uniref:DUF2721 domain-containing protein n=1 Tax=Xanthovirga aplysinae TaxID=2529853 RepID=UPI0012BCE63C